MWIYKITNTINNKIYIGQTTKTNESYFGSGKIIKKVIKKYGISNFIKEILEKCVDKIHLNEREIYWITFYNATDRNIGYNISKGGSGGNLGEEVNKLIKQNVPKGSKHRLFGKENLSRKGKGSWNKGKKMTEEQKEKLKKPKSEEHKLKLKLAKINYKPSQKALENSILNRQKKILCINNNIIYNSIKEAAISLNLQSPNIVNVLKNKSIHTKGYKFIYYEN